MQCGAKWRVLFERRACVTSVRPFGVFVRPDGWPQDGLVHASQVSTYGCET